MSSHNSTLASLWVDDGLGSPLKLQQPGPGASSNTTPDELKDDILKFYKDSGLEGAAKDAGILDPNGHLADLQDKPGPSYAPQAVQYIAVRTPVKSGTGGHTASSPLALLQTPPNIKVRAPRVIGTPGTVTSPFGSARKRPADDWMDLDLMPDAKRVRGRVGEKGGGKGLRHFSMKVCEKVQCKGVTTYNEVADELVNEFVGQRGISHTDAAHDQKNIRRRVYDALNVLMAMNIISKEKKEIRWIGLPTNSAQECRSLEIERQQRVDRIRKKTSQLQELIMQQVAFRKLVARNKENEDRLGGNPPPAHSSIQLPFIIVNTSKQTCIDCNISNDKHEYTFKFDNAFEIHDDIEVMKRMGLCLGLDSSQPSAAAISEGEALLPKPLHKYLREMANHGNSGSHPHTQSAAAGGSSQATASTTLLQRPRRRSDPEDSDDDLDSSYVDVN